MSSSTRPLPHVTDQFCVRCAGRRISRGRRPHRSGLAPPWQSDRREDGGVTAVDATCARTFRWPPSLSQQVRVFRCGQRAACWVRSHQGVPQLRTPVAGSRSALPPRSGRCRGLRDQDDVTVRAGSAASSSGTDGRTSGTGAVRPSRPVLGPWLFPGSTRGNPRDRSLMTTPAPPLIDIAGAMRCRPRTSARTTSMRSAIVVCGTGSSTCCRIRHSSRADGPRHPIATRLLSRKENSTCCEFAAWLSPRGTGWCSPGLSSALATTRGASA
jgi:hypothetical protein